MAGQTPVSTEDVVVFSRFIPKDEGFFEMFSDLARRVTAAARLLNTAFAEPHNLQQHVAAIKDLEHEADVITHAVIERIHKVFITPIDREDIHLLVQELDDVIDMIDGCARRAQMFQIREVREGGRRLAEVLVRATEAIEWAVTSMKQSKIVEARSREVKRLEEEGDAIYNQAVGELFAGNPDPIEVIKWKELYDTMERAIDQCEDVANVLESITIKHD
jgi:predicted phosphate transport protein (TIGR00153 family)